MSLYKGCLTLFSIVWKGCLIHVIVFKTFDFIFRQFYTSNMKKWLIGIFIFILGVVAWDISSISCYSIWLSNNLLMMPLTPEKSKEIHKILGQSFTYIDQGSTSEVFASEDGKYVIKVFLNKSYKSKSRKHIPLLGLLAGYRKTCKMKFLRASACLNAYGMLSHGTALTYYHLAPTEHFHMPLRLVDQKGDVKFLDLDKETYYIQKKAVVAGEYIQRCVEKGDLARAEKAIADLLEFTMHLYRQGIVMVDLQFTSNFGFIDDLPVRIDIEHLCFKESWKKKYGPHLKIQLKEFRSWIALSCPNNLLTFFDAKTDSICNIQNLE